MTQFLDIESLEKLTETHPDSVAAAHLAARLTEEGESGRAAEICRQVTGKHPEYAFAHFVLGLALYDEQNYSDAKREIEISLALDAAMPRAWAVLSQINEKLNLTMMTRESHLRQYLADSFNSAAAEQFFREEPAELPETEFTEEERTEEELSDAEIDNLIESAVTPETEEEEDINETLDEVFKETLSEPGEPRQFDVTEEPPEEAEEPESEPPRPSEDEIDEETKAAGDEFSSAMDSFFSEYEKQQTNEEFGAGGELPEEESPGEFEFPDDETETPETEIKTEEPEEYTENEKPEAELKAEEPDAFTGSETPEPEREFPEEFIEDEPMDFSSVVSDLIEDSAEEEEAMSEEELEEDQPGQLEEMEGPVEEPPQEDILEESISEEISSEEDQVEAQEGEGAAEMSSRDIEEMRKETTHFGRPPILSPTLGEIYLAQGRFEEAMDVFRKLLQKDPDNSRYKRKIEDLKRIIDKQQEDS